MIEQPSPTREAALALLSRRAYSVGVLTEKLMDKGCDPAQVAEAVSWLTELRYLDDEEYAREYVRAHVARGYGRHRTRVELRRRYIDDEIIEKVLEEMPDPEETVDQTIVRLAGHGIWDEKRRRRVADALYRRGFDWEDIRAGLARFETEEELD